MASTPRAFGTLPHDQAINDLFKAVHVNDCQLALQAGLSWPQILELFGEFYSAYGSDLVTIALAVISAITSGNPLVSLGTLVATWGPEIYDMAALIASWFSITLPPLPVGGPTGPATGPAPQKVSASRNPNVGQTGATGPAGAC